MKLIAIIPARKQSKRLPNKNYKEFFGKPMINWVLDEIKKSELFDKIIISTDKEEPVDITYGDQERKTETIIRKGEIANYDKTVDEVCFDVLKDYRDYDYLCCIYPTSYAMTWQDLCKSFSCMLSKGFDYCHSYGMKNGNFELDNGGFYWAKIKLFLEYKELLPTAKIRLMIVPQYSEIGERIEDLVIEPGQVIEVNHPDEITQIGASYKYEMSQVDINTLKDFAEAKIHASSNHRTRFNR